MAGVGLSESDLNMMMMCAPLLLPLPSQPWAEHSVYSVHIGHYWLNIAFLHVFPPFAIHSHNFVDVNYSAILHTWWVTFYIGEFILFTGPLNALVIFK